MNAANINAERGVEELGMKNLDLPVGGSLLIPNERFVTWEFESSRLRGREYDFSIWCDRRLALLLLR